MRKRDIAAGLLILWVSISGIFMVFLFLFNSNGINTLVTLLTFNNENILLRLFIVCPWVILVLLILLNIIGSIRRH